MLAQQCHTHSLFDQPLMTRSAATPSVLVLHIIRAGAKKHSFAAAVNRKFAALLACKAVSGLW